MEKIEAKTFLTKETFGQQVNNHAYTMTQTLTLKWYSL